MWRAEFETEFKICAGFGLSANTKGQLISKCPFGVKTSSKTSSKIPTKLFLDFCPEIFCSFLGASWKLFELPGGLSK